MNPDILNFANCVQICTSKTNRKRKGNSEDLSKNLSMSIKVDVEGGQIILSLWITECLLGL